MKLFYIAPMKLVAELKHVGYHWIDIGNEKVLLCVDWKDDFQEQEWANQTGVVSLPHPVFEHNTPLTDEHHAHLGAKFELKKGDNVHHVINKATKHDPWMRLHVL